LHLARPLVITAAALCHAKYGADKHKRQDAAGRAGLPFNDRLSLFACWNHATGMGNRRNEHKRRCKNRC
jgi:hypothetical protein